MPSAPSLAIDENFGDALGVQVGTTFLADLGSSGVVAIAILEEEEEAHPKLIVPSEDMSGRSRSLSSLPLSPYSLILRTVSNERLRGVCGDVRGNRRSARGMQSLVVDVVLVVIDGFGAFEWIMFQTDNIGDGSDIELVVRCDSKACGIVGKNVCCCICLVAMP